MGTVADKIAYTQIWVDDIYAALLEKGINVYYSPLEKIGNEIRKLHVNNNGGNGENFGSGGICNMPLGYGSHNGIRKQYLRVLEFAGDLSERDYKLTVPIECSNPNHPTYNEINDYYRTVKQITGFEYKHELVPATITNEREEF